MLYHLVCRHDSVSRLCYLVCASDSVSMLCHLVCKYDSVNILCHMVCKYDSDSRLCHLVCASEGVGDFPVLHFLPGLILFLTFISSCVLFDSYVLLADDHVNNVSYFPFMSIKKVIPYFCVLREGYYVIIWLIVRNCVFVKD